MTASVSHINPAPSDEVVAELLVDLGTALLRAANKLRQPLPAPVDTRPRSVREHEARMRRHRALLQCLVDAGGSMSRADFAWAAREMGYGKGYAQFYAESSHDKHERLTTISADRNTVTITDKGRARLDYAKKFLDRVDAPI